MVTFVYKGFGANLLILYYFYEWVRYFGVTGL